MTALEEQAIDLSRSTVYSRDSIYRLQSGLMNTNYLESGGALSESETLKAIPTLLQVDMVFGGNVGVGHIARMLKQKYELPGAMQLEAIVDNVGEEL